MEDYPLRFVVEEDRKLVIASTEKAMQGIQIADLEFRIRSRSGRQKWVSLSGQPIFNSYGANMGYRASLRDITKRKETEQELASTLKKLQLAIQSANIGLWDYDFQSNNLVWDEQMFKLYGITADSFKGGYDDWRLRLHPEDLDRADKEIQIAIQGGPQFSTEFRVVWPDYSVHHIRAMAAVIKDASGKAGRIVGINWDITESKNIETQLREHGQLATQALQLRESDLAQTQSVAHIGSWSWNVDADQIVWSDETYRIFGLDERPVRLATSDLEKLIHPDDLIKHNEILCCMLSGKVIPSYSFRLIRPDGAVRLVLITGLQVQKLADGKVHTVSGTVMDITEKKAAEDMLSLQGNALEAAANAIAITNRQGIIEWVNKSFCKLTGYSRQEITGQTHRMLKSGKHASEFYAQIWETVLKGSIWRGEIINQHKDGTHYTEEMTITPMKEEDGSIKHFIIVKHDITERKTLEKNLMRLDRLESIGTLSAGIAHDINNVLAPILLASDMLHSGKSMTASEPLLATIRESAQRGADIVKQLITFARGSDGATVPVKLDDVIHQTKLIIAETFPKNITTRCIIRPDLHIITGDPTQIHQILLNFCINARDAMPDGGTLLIQAENVEINTGFTANIPEAKTGSHVLLTVSDTGQGIPPGLVDKIFDPFFTTKAVGKGSGLGLSTALGIVRNHGGFIRLESELNKGTTFKVYLPACLQPAPHVDSPSEAEAPKGNEETILLVDDESAITTVTAMVLRNNGYKVLTADSTRQALRLYQSHSAEISAVLTDIMMPGPDGAHLAMTLKGINPGLKIIASSGKVSEELRLNLQAIGIGNILHKPYDSNTLLATVHQVIHP